jgi:heme-degrading monooxygenase HmoA
MFVRITRITAPPETLDEGAATFEQRLLPQLRTLPGYVGAALLADRASGRALAVTYWQTEEAMRGSEEAAAATRAQSTQPSTIVDVQRYDLAILERAQPPRANVFARVNAVQGSPAQVDASLSFLREQVLPVLRAQPGFRALLVGVDRERGHSLVSSIWETAADRDASEAAIRGVRTEAARTAGASDVQVEPYEVIFLELPG